MSREAKEVDVNIKDFQQKSETLEIEKIKFHRIVFNPKQFEKEISFSKDLKKSDLISGVYEGGFKVWECAVDLVKYLNQNNIDLKGKKVLDLGCGHAIPGIYALLKGAIVDFQDYNEEVIQFLTIPNVKLNFPEGIKTSKFYSGDWSKLDSFITTKYDYIFTCDTLYSCDNHKSLALFIQSHLNDQNSKCYVAAKSYYFGCGGGTSSFTDTIDELKTLSSSEALKISNGSSNVREILELKLK